MTQEDSGRFITPTLVLARAATTPMAGITSYLLIEIGLSFQQSVGVVSQIRTLQSIIAVVSALMMGLISVSYSPKILVIFGLVLTAISAMGCCISPSFLFLLLVFPVAGIGTAMVSPMTNTLVGMHLPREKRSSAIGLMMAGMAIMGVVGGFIINYLNGVGGWRLAFIGYALPVAIIVALLTHFWVPSSEADHPSHEEIGLLSGFKQVFNNRSALACLLGMTISQTTWQAILLFNASFYRQIFNVNIGTIVFLNIGYILFYITGNLFTGRYADRIGRRRLAVISLFFSGVFMLLFFSSSNMWISYAFGLLFCIMGGVRATSTQSHTMEQMRTARGTLMSCMSAAISLGAALGAGIGGYILLVSDYIAFGYVFSAINILGASIFFFLTRESTGLP